ncbi:MAG: SH3 domain-containing protein, partial [Caldilineaceae bacterium]|nr:SH3 domain-containing protein [Caldilineaceae bacterium]
MNRSPLTVDQHRPARAHWVRMLLLATLTGGLLLLAACGPEGGASDAALREQAQQIAQDYVASNDLAGAQSAIAELDVANPRQFVLLMAENNVKESSDPLLTSALVRLADALGLQSSVIDDYAAANGLVAADVATSDVVAANPEVVAAPVVKDAAPVAEQAAPAEDTAIAAPDTSQAAPADLPTSTPEPPTATPEPEPTATPTPNTAPRARILSALNVRNGPGTNYLVIGGLQEGEELTVLGKNEAADWWQIQLGDGVIGWVYGPLVDLLGDINSVVVADNIPAPPEVVVEAAPAPVEAVVEEAAPEPAAATDQPTFKLVEKRMWSIDENGTCQGQHLLRINVVDANGNRLNGVRMKGIYIGEILVTGAQGKGDGIIEYDLHGSG